MKAVLKLVFIALVGASSVYAQAQNEKGLRTAAGDFLASGPFSSSDIQEFEYAEDDEEDETYIELKCKGSRKRPRCKKGWRIKSCTARNAGAKKMTVRLYKCVRKREDVGGEGTHKLVAQGFVPTDEMVEEESFSSSDISEDESDYSDDEESSSDVVSEDENEEMDYAEDEEDTEVGKCRAYSGNRKPKCKRGRKVVRCKRKFGKPAYGKKCARRGEDDVSESTDYGYEADFKGTSAWSSSDVVSGVVSEDENEEMGYAEDEEDTEAGKCRAYSGNRKPKCKRGRKVVRCKRKFGKPAYGKKCARRGEDDIEIY